MPEVLVVIPARWDSSRFPGKPLADLEGEPLIVRTARAAARMSTAGRVVVATDDERIYEVVAAADLDVMMTGEHACGSDRIGEVAVVSGAEIIVNLQGDEPLLEPGDADGLVEVLRHDAGTDVATLAHPFADEAEWNDPNAVKVLCDDRGRAMMFTRAPVPGRHPGAQVDAWRLARRHVGIYAYRAEALRRFLATPKHPLERAEGLEQLRGLAAGLRYQVIETEHRPVGVDTPEDLERVRDLWRAGAAED